MSNFDQLAEKASSNQRAYTFSLFENQRYFKHLPISDYKIIVSHTKHTCKFLIESKRTSPCSSINHSSETAYDMTANNFATRVSTKLAFLSRMFSHTKYLLSWGSSAAVNARFIAECHTRTNKNTVLNSYG